VGQGPADTLPHAGWPGRHGLRDRREPPRRLRVDQAPGAIKNGVEDFDSAEVKAWAPAFENYRFVDKDGGTEVQVEMDSMPAYEDFLRDAWPKALAKLKAVCEERVAA
jgi:hypothetical protein